MMSDYRYRTLLKKVVEHMKDEQGVGHTIYTLLYIGCNAKELIELGFDRDSVMIASNYFADQQGNKV